MLPSFESESPLVLIRRLLPLDVVVVDVRVLALERVPPASPPPGDADAGNLDSEGPFPEFDDDPLLDLLWVVVEEIFDF